MDQIRIGRFIAATRKGLNMTQRQLADALDISDKTISKWECGNGLPEVSLMLPLCDALQISVNELLTCERISEADYQKKAEDNIMELMDENQKGKAGVKNRKILFVVIIVLAALCIVFWHQKNAAIEEMEAMKSLVCQRCAEQEAKHAEIEEAKALCQSSAINVLAYLKKYETTGNEYDFARSYEEFQSFMSAYLKVNDNVVNDEFLWCGAIYENMLLHSDIIQNDINGLIFAFEYLANDYDSSYGFYLLGEYANEFMDK